MSTSSFKGLCKSKILNLILFQCDGLFIQIQMNTIKRFTFLLIIWKMGSTIDSEDWNKNIIVFLKTNFTTGFAWLIHIYTLLLLLKVVETRTTIKIILCSCCKYTWRVPRHI